MPQPEGAELEEIRARRERLRERYLRRAADRPDTTAAGVHHVALICRFDIGNRNLLGFFDFHPPFTETIGGVQHIAISVSAEQFAVARRRLDEAGIDYLGPDRGVEDSLYFRDPNGVGLELYREDLGLFLGHPLLG
jgi:glyoxylase I family protein